MRKTAAALVLLPVVAAAGYAMGVAGIGLLAAVTLGVVVAGVVLVTKVSSDRLLWVATCLFVLTVTWNGIRLGGGGAVGNGFMVLAFAALASYVVVERRALPLPAWLLLAGTGLFFAQLLSLVIPPSVELTNKSAVQFISLYNTSVFVEGRSNIAELVKFEVSLVMVPVLIATAAASAWRARRLLDLFAASSVVSALVAIADYSGLHIGPVALLGDSRASGLTLHPNYLALGCTIAVPLTMLWLVRQDGRWRLAGLVAVPILLGGVMASGSRAGAVAAVTGVVLAAILLPDLRKRMVIILPVLAMMLVLIVGFTKVGHDVLHQVRLTDGSDVAGSDYQRTYVADVAVEQIKERPVQGVGFSVIADAHNIYLELLAAGGLIAFAAFAIFCGGLVQCARNARRWLHRDEATMAALGVVLWLAAGVVGNEVADKFLYVVPGVLVALSRVTDRERLTMRSRGATPAMRSNPVSPDGVRSGLESADVDAARPRAVREPMPV